MPFTAYYAVISEHLSHEVSMDIESYLRRIGYEGSAAAPTLDTLCEVHVRHPTAIAFENLDAFLGVTARLDPTALEQKLVHGGRGGWCFEQNLLLSRALRTLGFQVRDLAARVLWNAPVDVVRPRTHMVLLVELEAGRFLADVGFGGLTLTAPLRLETRIEQATPHEQFRLIEADEDYELQARVQGDWKSLYRFDLQAQTIADYELVNWYLSRHPLSHFRTNLMAARAAADRRYALLNDQLTIHHLHSASERRSLRDVNELRDVLAQTFLLQLSHSSDLDRALQRVFARSTEAVTQ